MTKEYLLSDDRKKEHIKHQTYIYMVNIKVLLGYYSIQVIILHVGNNIACR